MIRFFPYARTAIVAGTCIKEKWSEHVMSERCGTPLCKMEKARPMGDCEYYHMCIVQNFLEQR